MVLERNTLPDQLASWLSRPDACPSRKGLSPAMSYGRHSGPPRADARPAAVVILLYPRQGQWYLPVTRRQEHLAQHAGQVSLPGGTVDAGETTAQAALRELDEELGVAARQVRLLGTLTPVYLFNSNFDVTPWVAASNRELEFRPNVAEVAELIELPLRALLEPSAQQRTIIRRGGLEFSAPCIQWQDISIWGATHLMLGQFGRLLRERT
jgi:8-oxo-dGTP pyrophosphatase MutT (NUDIX family)